MEAQYTNPETGRTMTVFVHAAYSVDGEDYLKVNKGSKKSSCVFGVRASHTSASSFSYGVFR